MSDASDARELVTLQLCGSLSVLADPGSELSPRIRGAVQQSVDSVAARFGIPGSVDVELSSNEPDIDDGGRLLRLRVGGRTVRYSDELLRQAWCCVSGQLLDPEVTPSFIAARLLEGGSAAKSGEHSRVISFLSLLCENIVERAPASLLGPTQCRTYAAALKGGTRHDPEWLLEVLRPVLDLGISIADRRLVTSVLDNSDDDEAATIESLISALRRDSIDILFDKSTLRQLTDNWPADPSTVFPFLRRGLFDELGAPMPRCRFVILEDGWPGTFSFRINDSVSVPQVALRPDQLIANESAERLRLIDFPDAVPIANPATGHPNALLHISAEAQAQQSGLTTWTHSGHLILSLAEFWRNYGWRTIHRGVVKGQLDELEAAFPTLVRSVTLRHSDSELTGILRALVRDRVSIQNLSAILESLLDVDLMNEATVADANVTPSRPLDTVANARIALGPAISHQLARGTYTIVVYLLDAEIERLIVESGALLTEQRRDAILDALRNEMAYLPPTAQVPNILTTKAARAQLQRLVATEHPRISVIAYEELPAGRNVQPIARIAL